MAHWRYQLADQPGPVKGVSSIWGRFEGWQDALDSTGAHSMTNLGHLFAGRPWAALVPDLDHELLVDGAGRLDGPDYAAAARAPEFAIVYAPSPRSLGIDLGELEGDEVAAFFFDPADGSVIDAGAHPTDGRWDVDTPCPDDCVLVLDRSDAGLPRP